MDARDNDKLWEYEKQPCPHCNKYKTFKSYDGCLGDLIGVVNACCNHGGHGEGAYVQFFDGTSIHGEDAIVVQEILKRTKTEKTKQERYEFLKGSIEFHKEEWNL